MSAKAPHAKADRFANLVIRASAGAGKTFQLSNRFIGLLAAGEPFDTILATTFTRKAAGEILQRVLLRLAEAALDDAKLAELVEQLGDPSLDRPRCRALLRGLLRQLHRLRVGTLDSFFIQMAQGFSLELGLPPGWQIIDEVADQAMRAEAVRAVLRGEATHDTLRLMHLLTKGEATRSVAEQMTALVNELYGIYVEAPALAWQSLTRHTTLGDDKLQTAIDRLEAAPLPEDNRFVKAREDAVTSAAAGEWVEFIRKGLPAAILGGKQEYCRKPLPAELREALDVLVRHARAVLLGQIANQTEATHGLLERFDAAYQQLKVARRALRFEDVTRRLGDAWVGQRMDEVTYRLDARVAHLLLDEFQDTSPVQWRVLRPFARRVVGGGRQSFFCVGDVKQAIYGWRGGVAEIFEALEGELGPLQSEPLNRSYRSSPVVIDTVNRVFEDLGHNPVLAKHAEAARRWAERFQGHSTVHQDMPGHGRLMVAPRAAEGEEQAVATLRFAAGEIARLHREAPGGSIGVLVRKNVSVARLIYELRSGHQVEASEEGGNPLTDSPAVQLVLSLLALADHPGDTAARFHVATSPLAEWVGLTRHDDQAAALRLAHEIRARLMAEGYGPTLYGWVKALAAACDRRDLNRLVQLVELAYAYQPQATTRTNDFAQLVKQRRIEDPTSAAVRVMTVHQAKGLQFDIVVLPELDARLTGQPPRIVVGRPQPTGEIKHVCRWVSQEMRGLLPREFQRMFDEHEGRVIEESLCVLYVALTRAIRAMHIIIAPSRHNERSLPGTQAGLLRAALTDAAKAEPGAVLYEHGTPHWSAAWAEPVGWVERSEPHRPTSPVRLAPLVIQLAPLPAESFRGLERRSPTSLEHAIQPAGWDDSVGWVERSGTKGTVPFSLTRKSGQSPVEPHRPPRVDLARRMRLDASPGLDRGTLMHEWFRLIEWLEDGEPSDAALYEALPATTRATADLPVFIRQFRDALRRPAIRAALSRATYDRGADPSSACAILPGARLAQPRWRVWRERSFAVREADAILSGTFDRLVVLYDGQQPLGADVLDFKTDQVPADRPEAIAARVEQYRAQLEAYRRAAASTLRLPPNRVSARLAFVEPGVIEVV